MGDIELWASHNSPSPLPTPSQNMLSLTNGPDFTDGTLSKMQAGQREIPTDQAATTK